MSYKSDSYNIELGIDRICREMQKLNETTSKLCDALVKAQLDALMRGEEKPSKPDVYVNFKDSRDKDE